MIDTKDILKMATHVFKRGQGFYDKRSMHPTREWLIGLFIFAALIIIGGVQAAYTFVEYQNISTEGGSFTESMVQFNSTLSENAITTYSKRKDAFTKLQGSIPVQKPVETKTVTSGATTTKPDMVTEPESTTVNGGVDLAN
jgi:hypothetical protein